MQIGDKRARELLLLGGLFDAEEAHRVWLVSEIVEADALMERVRELKKLKANPAGGDGDDEEAVGGAEQDILDAAISARWRRMRRQGRRMTFIRGLQRFWGRGSRCGGSKTYLDRLAL